MCLCQLSVLSAVMWLSQWSCNAGVYAAAAAEDDDDEMVMIMMMMWYVKGFQLDAAVGSDSPDDGDITPDDQENIEEAIQHVNTALLLSRVSLPRHCGICLIVTLNHISCTMSGLDVYR